MTNLASLCFVLLFSPSLLFLSLFLEWKANREGKSPCESEFSVCSQGSSVLCFTANIQMSLFSFFFCLSILPPFIPFTHFLSTLFFLCNFLSWFFLPLPSFPNCCCLPWDACVIFNFHSLNVLSFLPTFSVSNPSFSGFYFCQQPLFCLSCFSLVSIFLIVLIFLQLFIHASFFSLLTFSHLLLFPFPDLIFQRYSFFPFIFNCFLFLDAFFL